MASPPVVKFLDFGQYKYDLTKREKEAKRKQRSVTFKEVRLSPKIGIGDFDTKVHRAIEFLEDGDRIKVTVRFRGRELTHPELGRDLLARFVDRVKDHGVPERAPLLEGKSMHITMASLHKPKTHDAPTAGAERRTRGRGGRDTGRQRLRPRRTAQRLRRSAPAARPAAARRPPSGARRQRRRPVRRRRQPRRRVAAAGRSKPAAAPAPVATTGAETGSDKTEQHRHPSRRRQESEARVPKIKSHKAAQKRIGVTGSGKVIRVNAWSGHHLEIKSSRRTRRYAGKSLIGPEHAKQVRRLLPYL